MNASFFNASLLGAEFNFQKALDCYYDTVFHPEDEYAKPDCPNCPNQTDGYGYCWACEKRTVFL